MNWQNILEGTIASLLAAGITSVTGMLIYKIGKKEAFLKNPDKKKFDWSNFTPFSVALCITSFFTILSGFSFYYQWTNMPYLITITMLIWMGTIWVFQDQCPNCKKIFKKKHVRREVISEEKIPHEYYDTILYLYNDGTLKDRQTGKKKKKWTEIVKVVRDHFVCTSCGHNWDSSIKRITINEGDRPKPVRITTRFRNPNSAF